MGKPAYNWKVGDHVVLLTAYPRLKPGDRGVVIRGLEGGVVKVLWQDGSQRNLFPYRLGPATITPLQQEALDYVSRELGRV